MVDSAFVPVASHSFYQLPAQETTSEQELFHSQPQQSVLLENNNTHVVHSAAHFVRVPRWEVSQYLGAIQPFPEKGVVLEGKEKNQKGKCFYKKIHIPDLETCILTGNVLTRFQLSFCVMKLEMPQPFMI